jgi:hypothetical protein
MHTKCSTKTPDHQQDAPTLVTGILCQKNIPHLFLFSPLLSMSLPLSMSLSAYSFLHFRLQFGYSFFHCKSVLSGVYLHTIPQQYFCLLKLSGLMSGTCFRLEPSKPNILDLKYWNKYTTLTTISNNPFLRVDCNAFTRWSQQVWRTKDSAFQFCFTQHAWVMRRSSVSIPV